MSSGYSFILLFLELSQRGNSLIIFQNKQKEDTSSVMLEKILAVKLEDSVVTGTEWSGRIHTAGGG